MSRGTRRLIIPTVLILSVVVVSILAWEFSRYARYRNQVMRTSNCYGNLAMIASGLHYYHEKYGSFPPAYIADEVGRPVHSWRILILEFINPDLYKEYRFTEPWDGPNNSNLRSRLPNCFACDNDVRAKRRCETSYLAVVGPETAFPNDDVVTLKDVTGDRGHTIHVVEIADSGIHWMEPRDFTIEEFLDPSIGRQPSTHDHIGPHMLMMDCQAVPMDESHTRRRLSWMVTISSQDDPMK